MGRVRTWIIWVNFCIICKLLLVLDFTPCMQEPNCTDMPSPGPSLKTPGKRQHIQTKKPSLAPRYQGTDRQAFPYDSFQSTPGDKTTQGHIQKPSPDIHFNLPGDGPHEDSLVEPDSHTESRRESGEPSMVVFNCGIQLGLQPLTSPKLVQLVQDTPRSPHGIYCGLLIRSTVTTDLVLYWYNYL